MEISPPPPFQVVVVAKRESQKVQTRSFLPQVDYPRLLPIDLQPQPSLDFRFNPAGQLFALEVRQHNQIVGIAHQFGFSPPGWTIGPMKQHVEPMPTIWL